MSSGYILHSDDTRVVIATTESDNRKTGNMIQIWILCRDTSPTDAVRSGLDADICGDCKLRGTDGWAGRTCYVNVAQGPHAVWRAYQAGRYDYLPQSRYPDVFCGRAVRFGAYGDPVHIPLGILRYICLFARRWTGYTHQWGKAQYRPYQEYLMASVDSELEYWRAHVYGWRCFRVRPAEAYMIPGEIACPAADETGHKTDCARCGLCNGRRAVLDVRKDISIIVHGIGRKNLIQIGA